MDTNMTFRIDSGVKNQMNEICSSLGMSVSTAFNIFANAFVREGGMPFEVTMRPVARYVSQEALLSDADIVLNEFAADYEELAK